MEGNTSFFDNLLKNQTEQYNNWMNMVKSWQGSFANPMAGGPGAGGAFNMFNTWSQTMGGALDSLLANFPTGAGKDSATRMFRGYDSYVKLYEMWTPIMKAMQEKGMSADAYKDMLDPSKYKGIMDKMFGFTSPDTATEFYGQASKLIETWGSSAQSFIAPWSAAMQKNMSAFSDMGTGANPDPGTNMLRNMFGAFEQTYGKAFKTPQVGKDREKLELIMKTADAYSEYLAKNTLFQHKMYVTGEAAMRKVIDSVAEKIKAGAEIKNYDEFYKLWSEINEKEYYALFVKEEFATIQGELTNAALTFRKLNQKTMEIYLADMPIPVRSEMDDVYKTIYDLKKRVRTLENRLKTKEGQ